MAEIPHCPECGVPQKITSEYLWLNSGAMVQSTNLSRRVGFIESQNLDPLYTGIGNIIGMPIDHLVIDIARRGTADYFGNIIQPEVRGMIRSDQLGLDVISDFMVTMASLNGFGKYKFLEVRYRGDKDDHTLMRITEPFSILLCIGAQAGGCEVVSGNPHQVAYREIAPDIFEVSAYASEASDVLAERMPIKEYHEREGDIELVRCVTCGGPLALGDFQWHLDRGVIMDSQSNRRMVMMGPEVQDPLFDELEKELGDTIPQTVVEAQRRFIKTGFYSSDELGDEEDFRTQLALRGMGNLREMRMGPAGLSLRIDNAANHLILVGTVQGLFEMVYNNGSHAEWQCSEEGDLDLEITLQKD